MPMILLVDFSFILEWFSAADPLFLIAQSIGIVATVLGILCVQINAPGRILVLQLVTNALVILNYLLLGSYPGCALCGVAIVHVLYNYRYIRRGKTPPRRSGRSGIRRRRFCRASATSTTISSRRTASIFSASI